MKRLVLLFGVCGIVLSVGAAGWLWMRPSDPERALARIKQLGGKVQFDETRRDRPVVKIDLQDCPAGDDDLVCLSAFPHLQYLILTGTRITDGGLKHLARLTELRGIALSGPAAGGDGLRRLGGMPALRELNLKGDELTDTSLVHLASLREIEELSLDSPRITDAGLAHLMEWKNLRELSLSGIGITDAGLVHLKRLRQLRELDLGNTRISEAGLAELRKALPAAFIYRTP